MTGHSELTILFGLPAAKFEIPEGECTVGSCETASVRIYHPGVSPEHCRIGFRNGRYWVEDAGSHSGTFLNGMPLEDRSPLASGDVIHLGEVCLRFDICVAGAPPPGGGGIFFRGKPASEIPTGAGPLVFGSEPGCDALLPSAEVCGRHAKLEADATGVTISLLNGMGECRVNGRHFDSRHLVIGDQIEIGPCRFQYDGQVLHLVGSGAGATLFADRLTVTVEGRRILDRASLSVSDHEFVGIIGPSGAGKSTLLGALNGLRPADSGKILLNGKDLYSDLPKFRREFGWVPQEDIVHRELTVTQALFFAARLRLPRDTPEREMARVILQTAGRLGLEKKMGVTVRDLSGGEIKKVSVAAELLCRPQILFLDEPTSGLDPGADAKLIELLRRLADGGCTVVSTTHNMENLHLLDKLVVMADGLVVFAGPPEDALQFFGVKGFTGIFLRLEQRKPVEWRDLYLGTQPSEFIPGPAGFAAPAPGARRKPAFQLPILLSRQWAILRADWRNFAILLGQPVLIGLLVAWAVRGTMDDASLQLFFVSVAILWFGCSNGAQEIVGEMPIYRRERLVGLRRSSYLVSKWMFLSLLTLLQGAVLFLITRYVGTRIGGDLAWQVAGLGLMSFLATSIGLAISAVSRSAMQGVLLVPLLIIPQIVLSGYTVPASMMGPTVRQASEAVPSYQLQKILDLSLLWHRKIDAETLQAHLQAFQNIALTLDLKIGDVLANPLPGKVALAVLGAWLVTAYAFTFFVLRSKEQGG